MNYDCVLLSFALHYEVSFLLWQLWFTLYAAFYNLTWMFKSFVSWWLNNKWILKEKWLLLPAFMYACAFFSWLWTNTSNRPDLVLVTLFSDPYKKILSRFVVIFRQEFKCTKQGFFVFHRYKIYKVLGLMLQSR